MGNGGYFRTSQTRKDKRQKTKEFTYNYVDRVRLAEGSLENHKYPTRGYGWRHNNSNSNINSNNNKSISHLDLATSCHSTAAGLNHWSTTTRPTLRHSRSLDYNQNIDRCQDALDIAEFYWRIDPEADVESYDNLVEGRIRTITTTTPPPLLPPSQTADNNNEHLKYYTEHHNHNHNHQQRYGGGVDENYHTSNNIYDHHHHRQQQHHHQQTTTCATVGVDGNNAATTITAAAAAVPNNNNNNNNTISSQLLQAFDFGSESCSLRRSRSLAVIREETFSDLQITSANSNRRRSQLIPRARLVNRTSGGGGSGGSAGAGTVNGFYREHHDRLIYGNNKNYLNGIITSGEEKLITNGDGPSSSSAVIDQETPRDGEGGIVDATTSDLYAHHYPASQQYRHHHHHHRHHHRQYYNDQQHQTTTTTTTREADDYYDNLKRLDALALGIAEHLHPWHNDKSDLESLNSDYFKNSLHQSTELKKQLEFEALEKAVNLLTAEKPRIYQSRTRQQRSAQANASHKFLTSVGDSCPENSQSSSAFPETTTSNSDDQTDSPSLSEQEYDLTRIEEIFKKTQLDGDEESYELISLTTTTRTRLETTEDEEDDDDEDDDDDDGISGSRARKISASSLADFTDYTDHTDADPDADAEAAIEPFHSSLKRSRAIGENIEKLIAYDSVYLSSEDGSEDTLIDDESRSINETNGGGDLTANQFVDRLEDIELNTTTTTTTLLHISIEDTVYEPQIKQTRTTIDNNNSVNRSSASQDKAQIEIATGIDEKSTGPLYTQILRIEHNADRATTPTPTTTTPAPTPASVVTAVATATPTPTPTPTAIAVESCNEPAGNNNITSTNICIPSTTTTATTPSTIVVGVTSSAASKPKILSVVEKRKLKRYSDNAHNANSNTTNINNTSSPPVDQPPRPPPLPPPPPFAYLKRQATDSLYIPFKVNLTENQYHSLPDITIGQSLKVSECIDAKLRSSYNFNNKSKHQQQQQQQPQQPQSLHGNDEVTTTASAQLLDNEYRIKETKTISNHNNSKLKHSHIQHENIVTTEEIYDSIKRFGRAHQKALQKEYEELNNNSNNNAGEGSTPDRTDRRQKPKEATATTTTSVTVSKAIPCPMTISDIRQSVAPDNDTQSTVENSIRYNNDNTSKIATTVAASASASIESVKFDDTSAITKSLGSNCSGDYQEQPKGASSIEVANFSKQIERRAKEIRESAAAGQIRRETSAIPTAPVASANDRSSNQFHIIVTDAQNNIIEEDSIDGNHGESLGRGRQRVGNRQDSDKIATGQENVKNVNNNEDDEEDEDRGYRQLVGSSIYRATAATATTRKADDAERWHSIVTEAIITNKSKNNRAGSLKRVHSKTKRHHHQHQQENQQEYRSTIEKNQFVGGDSTIGKTKEHRVLSTQIYKARPVKVLASTDSLRRTNRQQYYKHHQQHQQQPPSPQRQEEGNNKMSRPQILHVVDNKSNAAIAMANASKDTNSTEDEYLKKVDAVRCYWSKLAKDEEERYQHEQQQQQQRPPSPEESKQTAIAAAKQSMPTTTTTTASPASAAITGPRHFVLGAHSRPEASRLPAINQDDFCSFMPSIEIVELDGQKTATIVSAVGGGGGDDDDDAAVALTNDASEPQFDHIRYKVIKSEQLIRNNATVARTRREAQFDGLIQYLQEYSFQELLSNNNVVIVEPVRTKIERPLMMTGTGMGMATTKVAASSKWGGRQGAASSTASASTSAAGTATASSAKATSQERDSNEVGASRDDGHGTTKTRTITNSHSGIGGIRRHFFYQPVRVNRELYEEELPHPDTVRNVRRFFEANILPTPGRGVMVRHSNAAAAVANGDGVDGEKPAESVIGSPKSRRSRKYRYLTIDTSYGHQSSITAAQKLHTTTSTTAMTTTAVAGAITPDEHPRHHQQQQHQQQQSNSRKWDTASLSSGISSSGDLSSPCECNDADASSGAIKSCSTRAPPPTNETKQQMVDDPQPIDNVESIGQKASHVSPRGRPLLPPPSARGYSIVSSASAATAAAGQLSETNHYRDIYEFNIARGRYKASEDENDGYGDDDDDNSSFAGDDDDELDESYYVSNDVLEKIRECGSTVTYYGGRVFQSNSPDLLMYQRSNNNKNNNSATAAAPSTLSTTKKTRGIGSQPSELEAETDPASYSGIKFKLVKSNSCSSRLELAGAGVEILEGPDHEMSECEIVRKMVNHFESNTKGTPEVATDNMGQQQQHHHQNSNQMTNETMTLFTSPPTASRQQQQQQQLEVDVEQQKFPQRPSAAAAARARATDKTKSTELTRKQETSTTAAETSDIVIINGRVEEDNNDKEIAKRITDVTGSSSSSSPASSSSTGGIFLSNLGPGNSSVNRWRCDSNTKSDVDAAAPVTTTTAAASITSTAKICRNKNVDLAFRMVKPQQPPQSQMQLKSTAMSNAHSHTQPNELNCRDNNDNNDNGNDNKNPNESMRVAHKAAATKGTSATVVVTNSGVGSGAGGTSAAGVTKTFQSNLPFSNNEPKDKEDNNVKRIIAIGNEKSTSTSIGTTRAASTTTTFVSYGRSTSSSTVTMPSQILVPVEIHRAGEPSPTIRSTAIGGSSTIAPLPPPSMVVKHYVANDKSLFEKRKYDDIEFEEFEVYDPTKDFEKLIENVEGKDDDGDGDERQPPEQTKSKIIDCRLRGTQAAITCNVSNSIDDDDNDDDRDDVDALDTGNRDDIRDDNVRRRPRRRPRITVDDCCPAAADDAKSKIDTDCYDSLDDRL